MLQPNHFIIVQIAALQNRLSLLRAPDLHLGADIIASIKRLSAASHTLGKTSTSEISTTLDVTGSMDGVLSLFDALLPDAEWHMFHIRRIGPDADVSQAPYTINIETPGVLNIGHGWTRPVCILDGILRALQPPD